jgi:nucleotide-binding universal stress UspA family protein
MKTEPSSVICPLDLRSIGRILVASDFSACSRAAVATGLKLARDTGAGLVVLHVDEDTPSVPWGTRARQYLAAHDAHREAARSRLEDLLHAQEKDLAGLRVEYLAVEGDPATEIVKTAFDCGADLILVASHGRRGVNRLLLGSTAEKVVRYASCPVLVVRDSKPGLDLPPVREAACLQATPGESSSPPAERARSKPQDLRSRRTPVSPTFTLL